MPTSYPASSVATAQHHGDTRRAFRTRTTISTRKPCASFPTWKRWALSIAFGWSLFYVALGCYWSLGGAGFPFGRNDATGPDAGSLLAAFERPEGAPIVAAVAAVAMVIAGLMIHRRPTGARRALLACGAAAVVVLLVGVVLDARSITLLPPLGLFGWTAIEDWPTLNQLLVGVGACAWVAATAAFVTSTGRHHPDALQQRQRNARRWVHIGRVAAIVAVLCPLPYAVIRWSWAFGRPIGAPRSFVEMLERNQPGVAVMEAVLATFACTGAVLTAGLYMRWGRRFPAWLPRIGGRPVPVWFPVGLGTSAAVAIFPFGRTAWHEFVGIRVPGTLDEHQLWGLDPGRSRFWGVGGLGWLFPIWSLALGIALVGYSNRRRLDDHLEAVAPRAARRPLRRARTAVVSVLAAAFTMAVLPSHGDTAGWITPVSPHLPAPTGIWEVGVRDVHLVDGSRSDPLDPSAGRRELMVRVHYPAAASSKDELEDLALAPYTSEPVANEWGSAANVDLGLRQDAVNWQFRTHAHLYAPVQPGHHPVAVFTPGPCQLRSSFTLMAEELASHGYVVVAIDHTHEAPVVEFPHRHLVRSRATSCNESRLDHQRAELRAADIMFVVSHLPRLGAELGTTLDDEHVGLYGYVPLGRPEYAAVASTGALDAIATMETTEEHRSRRAAAVPTSAPTLVARAALHGPLRSIGEPLVGPSRWYAELTLDGDPTAAFTDAGAYLPQLAGRYPQLADRRPQLRQTATTPATAIVRRYVRAFLDIHLTDRVVSDLDRGSRRWPGGAITVTVTGWRFRR